MKKKLFLILITIIFIIIITPINTAFADSWDNTSKTVTIDTDWTGSTLERAVQSVHYRATDIITLNITTGILTDEDVMWITENLSNLETLSITGAATFENNDLPDYAFNAKNYYGALTKLRNITIALDDINPITFGDNAFNSCETLITINMPNIIEFGNNAFCNCNTLTNISLPKTESFGYGAFSRCLLLTDISLPNAITFGNSVFSYCNALTEIDLPNATIFGNNAFTRCSMLTDITLPQATTFGDNAFYYCTNLTEINLPEATSFGKETFRYSKKLTTIDLPKAISFGEKSFYELNALTSVTLSEATTFGDCAFWGCTSLTNISLSKAITFEDFPFYKCTSLTDIDLPNATTFGVCAFQNCDSLTTLNLPKATTFDNSAFCSCDALTDITLPEAISFGRYAFRESNALVNVNLPKATTFGNDAFYKCKALTDISLPEATSFGGNAFYECTNLTNAELPKVSIIGYRGFYKCTSLANINLSSIKEFGGYQFGQCIKPITMILGETPPVEKGQPYPGGTCNVFQNSSNYGPSKIIVPQSAVDTYKQDLDGYGRWYYWVIDSLSDDATLYNLRINAKNIKNYDPSTTTYNLEITAASSIEIEAFKNDSSAVITGDTGIQNLNYGDNKFTISVTAEDGTTTKDYIINITRGYVLSYTAESGGSITGTPSQIVAPNGNGTEVIAVPVAGYKFTKWSDNKTEASRTDTNITGDITVEAEFTKPSDDATLSNIKIDSEIITGFNSSTSTYNLGITTSSSIKISAITSDTNATVAGNTGSQNLTYGSNTFTITVTAEDGTTKNYLLNITRGYELSYTAGTGGSISGTAIQLIEPNRNGTEVTAVADPGYKFTKWSDNKTESSRTDSNVNSTITVEAEFIKLSDDTTLSDLTIDSETITNFDSETTNYNLEITTASGIEISATSNDANATITGIGTKPLNFGDNTFTIKVTAEDETTKDYTINITRGYELSYTAGTGGSISGTAIQIVEPNGNGIEVTAIADPGYDFSKWNDDKTTASRTDANITSDASITAEFKVHHSNSNKKNIVTGKAGNNSFNAGTKKTTNNSDGKKETTVTVNQNALRNQVAKVVKKDKITIPVLGNGEIEKARLTLLSIKNMQEKDLILEIETDDVTYELPTNLIDVNEISEEIGVEIALNDIAFTVIISKTNDEMAKVVESSAEKGMLEIVVPPIDFEVEANHKDKSCKINKFNSFVTRSIEIPSNVDADKITTAVITEADGSMRHIPTFITIIDGKYYAKINSLTNSTYILIYNEVTFSDVTDSHWAKKDIEKMASRLVVEGKDNGTFSPNESITRAELAQILVKALGLKPVEIDKFVDVEKNSTYAGYIGTAYNYGIIKGTSETTFNPNGRVTRQDAMTMIYRTGALVNLVVEDYTIDMTGYKDYINVSSYAKNAVMWNVSNGIIVGKTATTLVPFDNITRAELSAVTNRFLKSANLID